MSTNWNQGSIETTGVPSDLAVSGDGFLRRARRHRAARTTRATGPSASAPTRSSPTPRACSSRVGWPMTTSRSTPSGATESINIRLGSMRLAKATQNVYLTGNLNSSGEAATQGSAISTQALVDDTGGTRRRGRHAPYQPQRRRRQRRWFADGDVITLTASKGGRDITPATFTVTAASTLGGADPQTSLAAWLEAKLGIDNVRRRSRHPGHHHRRRDGRLAHQRQLRRGQRPERDPAFLLRRRRPTLHYHQDASGRRGKRLHALYRLRQPRQRGHGQHVLRPGVEVLDRQHLAMVRRVRRRQRRLAARSAPAP